MRSTVDAGGADPDNARRSGAGDCDLRAAIGASGARVTAGPARVAQHPGALRRGPAAASAGAAVCGSRRVRRAYVRRTRAKLPPRNGETPAAQAACVRSPPPLYVSSAAGACSCSRYRPSGSARRRCALDDGIITRNPLKARSVQKPQAIWTEATPWTAAEVEAVADQLPGHLAALPYLGSACGMRQGELFGATVGDLDFLRKIMHVDVQVKYLAGCLFFAPVKNRKTRDVPVADPVIPVLAEHVRQYPPVKVTLPWGAPDGKLVTRELMFTTPDGRALNRNAFNRLSVVRWIKFDAG
jgi:integrase